MVFPLLPVLTSFQKKVSIALGIAVLGLGLSVFLMARHILQLKEEQGILEEQNRQYAQAVNDLNLRILDLRVEAEKVDQILVQKDRAISRLASASRQAKTEIEDHAKSTEALKAWSDSVVPSTMVDRLLDTTTRTSEIDSGKTISTKKPG